MSAAKSALLALCEKKSWDEVRAFLTDKKKKLKKEQIAFVSEEGLTSLAHACLEEVLDVVELLLKAGADPRVSEPEGINCVHVRRSLPRTSQAHSYSCRLATAVSGTCHHPERCANDGLLAR